MAKKKSGSGYEQLRLSLKNGEIGNLYLFFGDEEYIKNEYVNMLRERLPEDPFDGFNTVIHEGAVTDFNEMDAVLENFPMMAEKKTVIIKNSGIFKSASDEAKRFWSAKLGSLADYVTLIFIEKEADKRSALYKAVVKNGIAAEFEHLSPDDMANWASGEFLKHGKKITKENVIYFVGLCEDDVASVKNEIDKLASYCGDEVLRSDIDSIVTRSVNVRVFEMTDGIMEHDAGKVMTTLAELRSMKEPAFRILYTLSGAFANMLKAQLLDRAGMTYNEVVSALGVHPYAAGKYINGAQKFDERFLVDRVRAAAEADLSVKRGDMTDWDALEAYTSECIYTARA